MINGQGSFDALGRTVSLGGDSVECLGCVPESTRKIREIIFNFKSSLPAFFPLPFSCYFFPICAGEKQEIDFVLISPTVILVESQESKKTEFYLLAGL